jgi:catechol 2,3-dioxygenase-like lactoylglutathione lyase family enzyme
MIFPKTFSHIGLSVTDLEKAVKFYTEVFGFYVIMPPTEITEDDSIGIEIFEFPNAEDPENNFEYWKTGIFHFCFQDPDIESLAKKIVAHGGKQRMPVREYYPGEKPYRMVYCEDPFGNIIELYSHSYELTYSAGAYQDATA